MTELITKLLTVAILIIASGILKLILYYTKQTWSQTFSYTSTIFLLPLITYVITSVISGNIALSLGMVGALSIVRFRHPVRSPFELTLYFYSISLGIAAGVSLKWLVFLIVIVNTSLFLLTFINKIIKKKYKFDYFKTSFSEGNSLPTLELRLKKPSKDLLDSKDLISYINSNDEHIYILCNTNKDELKRLLENNKNEILFSNFKL